MHEGSTDVHCPCYFDAINFFLPLMIYGKIGRVKKTQSTLKGRDVLDPCGLNPSKYFLSFPYLVTRFFYRILPFRVILNKIESWRLCNYFRHFNLVFIQFHATHYIYAIANAISMLDIDVFSEYRKHCGGLK